MVISGRFALVASEQTMATGPLHGMTIREKPPNKMMVPTFRAGGGGGVGWGGPLEAPKTAFRRPVSSSGRFLRSLRFRAQEHRVGVLPRAVQAQQGPTTARPLGGEADPLALLDGCEIKSLLPPVGFFVAKSLMSPFEQGVKYNV